MPFDHVAGREAFRQHALSLVVATTGSVTIGTDTAGYTRAAGSFITDGFAAGMEVAGTGFPGSVGAAAMIETVSAAAMTITGGRTVAAPAGSRTLSVGLPADRRWQGTQTPITTVTATRPAFLDQWVPGITADSGAIIDTGFYVLTWNGLSNKGIVAMFRQMQALRDLFPPGYSVFVGDWLLRVTGDPAPSFSAPITTINGYDTMSLRIPWRIVTSSNRAA